MSLTVAVNCLFCIYFQYVALLSLQQILLRTFSFWKQICKREIGSAVRFFNSYIHRLPSSPLTNTARQLASRKVTLQVASRKISKSDSVDMTKIDKMLCGIKTTQEAVNEAERPKTKDILGKEMRCIDMGICHGCRCAGLVGMLYECLLFSTSEPTGKPFSELHAVFLHFSPVTRLRVINGSH